MLSVGVVQISSNIYSALILRIRLQRLPHTSSLLHKLHNRPRSSHPWAFLLLQRPRWRYAVFWFAGETQSIRRFVQSPPVLQNGNRSRLGTSLRPCTFSTKCSASSFQCLFFDETSNKDYGRVILTEATCHIALFLLEVFGLASNGQSVMRSPSLRLRRL